jgi:hypothetical protein
MFVTAVPAHFIAKQTAADTNPEFAFHAHTPPFLNGCLQKDNGPTYKIRG